MPGISLTKDLPRLFYHRRALRNELLLRALTGSSFFTIRVLAVLQSTLALKRQMNSSWNVMVGTTKKSKETKSLL